MSGWNYRVFKVKENGFTHFELREVHYDDKDKPEHSCEAKILGDNKKDLIAGLEMMLKDAKAKVKVLNDDKGGYAPVPMSPIEVLDRLGAK